MPWQRVINSKGMISHRFVLLSIVLVNCDETNGVVSPGALSDRQMSFA